MPNLDSSDLRDPQPPVPGERERALVAARADQLGRRRRLLQGGGALALVAAVAVSVAALTAGGPSGPAGTNRVEAASGRVDTTTVAPSTAPPTTTPATVPTTVPAPVTTPDTAPAAQEAPTVGPATAPAAQEAPAVVPSTFTLSGTVTGNPADTTVSVTISGPGGSFTSNGSSFSASGLPAGNYLVIAQWTSTDGTATAAVKQPVTVNGDTSVTISF
jgi:outer membrane biosynthesis protein TonB